MLKKCLIIFLFCISTLHAHAQTTLAPLVEKVLPLAVNVSARLAENADRPEVVRQLLFTTPDGKTAFGSGFVVREDGYIITNRHVIENSEEISVAVNENEVFAAKLAGIDYQTDIALLKISAEKNLKAVVFGDSSKSCVGDWVLAIGNPFGLGKSVSAGIISAKNRDIGDDSLVNFLQTDAAINQGNSGGPLFNMAGELIGMNTAIFSDSGMNAGVAFALPAEQIKWVMDQLIEKGKVERSWIGVKVKKVVTKNGMSGLSVVSLAEERIGDINDLRSGDILLELNNDKIISEQSFADFISKLAPNSEIKVKILRDGEIIERILKTALMADRQNMEKPEAEEEKSTSGKLFSALGIRINGTEVVSVLKGSEAENKGITQGDVIIRADHHPALSEENLELYFNDALINGKPLRLDMEDKNKEGYYVELNTDKKENQNAH